MAFPGLEDDARKSKGIFGLGFVKASTGRADADERARAQAVREMKAIDAILDAYRSEKLHLGEAALVMVQIVDYDVPAIRSSQQRIMSQVRRRL